MSLLSEIPQEPSELGGGHKKRYTPGLALFKFNPQNDWTADEAQKLYSMNPISRINHDSIVYEDCIAGMENMPSNCVDLVIADPPFGLDFSGKASVYNRNKGLVLDSYQEIDSNYGEFSEKWISLIQKVMKPNATAYIFSGWNHLEDILRAARLSDLTTVNHLIWKYQFGVFTKKKYVTSHYHVILLAKNSDNYYFNKIEHYPEDVWDIKRKYKKGEIKNATTLPIEVVQKCIEFSSKPGDLIFDPFMGMGTTAVVAKSTWRHYFGFESNEKLRPVIHKRINDTRTGQNYTPLEEKLRKIRFEAQKKYPSAYKLYLKECEGEIDEQS